jgi:hypothetical protein
MTLERASAFERTHTPTIENRQAPRRRGCAFGATTRAADSPRDLRAQRTCLGPDQPI